MNEPESPEPIVAMMMAMDQNRLIGKEGGLPWHIPGELQYFKSVTLGKPVLMGRKTFESIGKPLPGRSNIVVTRDQNWQHDDTVVVHDLAGALAAGREIAISEGTFSSEVMVIGGAALCREAMPVTKRLYLTCIDHAFDGDTWLDSFHEADWREVSHQKRDPATTGGLDVTYRVLERVAWITGGSGS